MTLELVSQADIGKMWGVSRQRAQQVIAAAGDAFPAPVGRFGKSWLWDRAVIERFERPSKRPVPEHGSRLRYRNGCRCRVCRAGVYVRNRDLKANRLERAIPADVPHGASTYTNWGCRCEECTVAHSARMKRDRRRRLAGPIPAHVKHGKPSTYINWGCRCGPCTEAELLRTGRRQSTTPKPDLRSSHEKS